MVPLSVFNDFYEVFYLAAETVISLDKPVTSLEP